MTEGQGEGDEEARYCSVTYRFISLPLPPVKRRKEL